jgi:hypothetical protein
MQSDAKQERFDAFWKRIELKVHRHQVIRNNRFCIWFSSGEANTAQVIHFLEQFGVFSKHFVPIQAKRVARATGLESERLARHILVNECGVRLGADKTPENQTFRTEWAHIEWLRETCALLKLDPERLGNWRTATPSTRRFLIELEKAYGSLDWRIAGGASYGIETWAAWGIGKGEEAESKNFWKQLIIGLNGFNHTQRLLHSLDPIPLGFFEHHFELETGHGENVYGELLKTFSQPKFDEGKFIEGGRRALDALYVFWEGLNAARTALT